MTATGRIRGREVFWDGERYRWSDTFTPAAGWGGPERPCPSCHQVADSDVDPCLGHLSGVVSACCGHGLEGWINFADGQDQT